MGQTPNTQRNNKQLRMPSKVTQKFRSWSSILQIASPTSQTDSPIWSIRPLGRPHHQFFFCIFLQAKCFITYSSSHSKVFINWAADMARPASGTSANCWTENSKFNKFFEQLLELLFSGRRAGEKPEGSIFKCLHKSAWKMRGIKLSMQFECIISSTLRRVLRACLACYHKEYFKVYNKASIVFAGSPFFCAGAIWC